MYRFSLFCVLLLLAGVVQSQYYGNNNNQFNSFASLPRSTTVPVKAVAVVTGQNVTGVVTFEMTPTNSVRVSGVINGLTQGMHGFHIHQYGDMREGCKSMAGHFNPEQNQHGAPQDSFRHVGDLGNILAERDGAASFEIVDNRISLTGPFSIVGRGLVVHAMADDLGRGTVEESRKTGNAGARVACGVVSLAK